MKKNFVWSMSVIFVLAAPVLAHGEYLSSLERDATKLIADRLRFVREMYQLDEATVQKLLEELSGLSSFHEKYALESGKSLYRIELAMNLVAQDAAVSEEDKQMRLDRFQEQINGIHARAPLSLSSVMSRIEKDLSKEKVDAARVRIAAHFSPKLAGAALNPSRIDSLLVEPIKPGARPDMVTAITRNTTPPIPVTPASPPAAAPTATTPPTQTITPDVQRATPPPIPPKPREANIVPATPPAPPREIPPAPPESDWSERMKEIAEKYGYSAEQVKVAERALSQCMARATQHREERKGDFSETAAMSDGPPKESKLKDLHRTLDMLYDEMVQRVESLASIEQQNKSSKKDKPAG